MKLRSRCFAMISPSGSPSTIANRRGERSIASPCRLTNHHSCLKNAIAPTSFKRSGAQSGARIRCPWAVGEYKKCCAAAARIDSVLMLVPDRRLGRSPDSFIIAVQGGNSASLAPSKRPCVTKVPYGKGHMENRSGFDPLHTSSATQAVTKKSDQRELWIRSDANISRNGRRRRPQ